MQTISVIGAGTMGNGIAHVFALKGFRVSLIDTQTPRLEKALQTIATNLDRQLDAHAPDACILASNTSSISITRIASVTRRPGSVIGLHFMNPVPVMKLVEIINGYATDQHITRQMVELSEKLGKTPCVVNDYPGF